MPDTPKQTIELVLDIPIPLVLTANQRHIRPVQAVISKALRGIASQHAERYLERNPFFRPFRYYTVYFEVLNTTASMRLDPNNYAPTLKPIIDGFTGRWWDDDDAAHLLEYTCAYGGLWKSPKEEIVKRRRFHIIITEADPDDYHTTPTTRPELDEIAKEWEVDEHQPVTQKPEDGDFDPNSGVKEYFKILRREERKKEAQKEKRAVAKLIPPENNDDPGDVEYKLELAPQTSDAPTQEPDELNW